MNLSDRRSAVLVEQISILRAAVRTVRAKRPFWIDAWVILPEHMHCVWTRPQDAADYPGRWKQIKSVFSRSIPHGEAMCESRKSRSERGVWQRRYWEHTIRDDADYAAHIDYVHLNPLKHRLVERVNGCRKVWKTIPPTPRAVESSTRRVEKRSAFHQSPSRQIVNHSVEKHSAFRLPPRRPILNAQSGKAQRHPPLRFKLTRSL
ncbi:MAG: transposase [Pseudomonadota bacterium]